MRQNQGYYISINIAREKKIFTNILSTNSKYNNNWVQFIVTPVY